MNVSKAQNVSPHPGQKPTYNGGYLPCLITIRPTGPQQSITPIKPSVDKSITKTADLYRRDSSATESTAIESDSSVSEHSEASKEMTTFELPEDSQRCFEFEEFEMLIPTEKFIQSGADIGYDRNTMIKTIRVIMNHDDNISRDHDLPIPRADLFDILDDVGVR